MTRLNVIRIDDDNSDDDDRIILESEEEKSQQEEEEESSSSIDARRTAATAVLAVVSKQPSRLQQLLQLYVHYISKSLHHDRGIKLLQWTLWLSSRLTRRHRPLLSTSLRTLYNDLSMARYVTRSLGFPAALEATQSGSWSMTSAKYPRLQKVLGQVMAWSMVGYYPTELLAYLHWTVPSLVSKHAQQPPRTAERWSYWSCRFWLLYIAAETCQCALAYKERMDEQQQISCAKDNGDDDNKLAKAERQQVLRYSKLQLVRNALFVLPCVQWSLPNWDKDPWLPESLVNGLMWLESVVCLFQ